MEGVYENTHIVLKYTREKTMLMKNKNNKMKRCEQNSLPKNFRILRKYKNKWDCLMFEMLFIKDLKPTFNKQKDSISSKVF